LPPYLNKFSLLTSFITLLIVFTLCSSTAYAASTKTIAIFYPKAKEPYRSIYQEIISGSHNASRELKKNIRFESFIIDKDFDSEAITKQLIEKNIHKVIVLGYSGWKLAKKISPHLLPDGKKAFHVVSGALPISPNGISGISLITDPSYLFNYLKQVAPNVKHIHVAYSKKSTWLIDLAKIAAEQQGLTLQLKHVADTKAAIAFYQQLFNSGVSNQDAIWLPLDRISSNDKIILPLILEKAWLKEVIVFSSKPSHAKRGVLFSTYPDNFALGKHLFTMVQGLDKQPEKKNFSPLRSTRLAVNLRTAAHLGLKYSAKQQQQFELTFPK
jgi:putative ABC transport system substrate-binding protein